MTSGILGLGVKALGFKKYFKGAREQQLAINISFDTDSKQLTLGGTLSNKEIEGGALSGGVIYGFSKTTEKEESHEAKIGYDFKEDKFVAEVESNPKEGEEAEVKEVNEGTLGIGTVTSDENAELTKLSIGLNPETNLFLVGAGVGVNISVEENQKKEEDE